MNDLFSGKAVQALEPDALSKIQAQSELSRLHEALAHHNQRYHGEDKPEISDAEYDKLFKRYQAIEALFPDLKRADSFSEKVGFTPLEKFKKVAHLVPMLSLSNAFSKDDITQFLEKLRRFLGLSDTSSIAIYAEPKLDGISFSATYEAGKFVKAATRGDGEVGEDITENIRAMGIKPTLEGTSFPELLEIRGEIFMSHADFNQLNADQEAAGKTGFANPRNAAAGSVRQLDPNITATRSLAYMVYALGESSNLIIESQHAMIEQFKAWGLPTIPIAKLLDVTDASVIMAFYEEMQTIRPSLEYDIDGIVYKVDDRKLQARLGNVARSPRWAIAHKFPAEQAESRIQSITIQVGRTGQLTPVAELDPITVGGVVVARATLHNEEEIARKDIRVGDQVVIQRAGDVIPQIVSVVKSKRPKKSEAFTMPERCPVCDSITIKAEGEVMRRCTGGLVCPSQMTEQLKHFVSRDAFDIDGLGSRQIEAFWQDGLIKNPVDIFLLEERNRNSLTPLSAREGMGTKSVKKLFEAINERRTISLGRFIYALGIRYVGEVSAKVLAYYFQDIEHLKEAILHPESFTDLTEMDGIGDVVVTSLQEFFSETHNVEIVLTLCDMLNIEPVEIIESDSPMSGKRVVFTGSLQHITRQEAKAQAEKLGAKVSGSVSKQTDYVVYGDAAGSKLKQAQTLGVTLLTEEEWMTFVK